MASVPTLPGSCTPGERRSWAGPAFEVVDPATGAPIATVQEHSLDDVRRAIDLAEPAQRAWRDIGASVRATCLRSGATLLRERMGALSATITAEQGKPLGESEKEVSYAASYLDWFASEAERAYGLTLPPAGRDRRGLTLRQPVGICGAITPWNFPLAMLARKVAPALAAGCSMVAKPAAETPLSALHLADLLSRAGVPEGVLSVVTSTDPAGVADVLLGDSRVRKLSFTGSTPVGRHLIERSAEHITRLSLELGGHAPFLVYADADLHAAAGALMEAKFRNAGQTCIAINRVLVEDVVVERFAEHLVHRVGSLRVGPGDRPGTDVGPLIDEMAATKVLGHIEDARERGARVLVGGGARTGTGLRDGVYVDPTVIVDVPADARIWREETFGPVVAVRTCRRGDLIPAANDTPFGLAAYVAARDINTVMDAVERLDFGIVAVNDGLPSLAAAPFGGMKASGYGREGGPNGVDEYLDVKYISIGTHDGGQR